MPDRELDPRYVERAQEVVRRAARWPEGQELRVFMGMDTRELVAQIGLALEEAEGGIIRAMTVDEARPETFAEAVVWLRERPDLVVDDSAWPGWADGDGE